MNAVRETIGSSLSSSGSQARVFRAPGRVNLIGEHTDYNDGFVLPVAIDFSTWVTISPRDDRVVSLYSENFHEQVDFDLDGTERGPQKHWSDYVKGVAITLDQSGYRMRGAQLHIRGDVPLGSGLSSSAAIEVATGYALLENSGFAVDRAHLARLCQRAENEFVGVRCGIMDQFISSHGKFGKALFLDCRSQDYKLLPLSSQAGLVICNTMVKHELAGGEYNKRRLECEEGVHRLRQRLPQVQALRDVTIADLESHRGELSGLVYRRCRHVISENARVEKAAAALERNDLSTFGGLMDESHRSLRDDYEVSCDELDLMVNLAQAQPGVYGARMTGGGFGGCTVNLVASEHVGEFKRRISDAYQQATGLAPDIYSCNAAEGAEEMHSDD